MRSSHRPIRSPRGRSVAICAFLLVFAAVAVAQQPVLHQLRDSGRRDNRINIVILSEGYTTGELDTKFTADAENLMNKFLSTQPYQEYRDYINFFTVAVASPESGSDHPARNIFRNTYFNSTFDSYGQDRLLTIPPNDKDSSYNNGAGKVFNLVAGLVPDYDLVLMVVNDPEYGGSGGPVSICSTDEFAGDIAVHEVGHTFADLADEYEVDAPQITPVEKANVTQQTVRELIKWRAWILANTPVPTPEPGDSDSTYPYFDVVGLFEGANYRPTGWYRPKLGCKMNALGYPFCEVCSEALLINIYKRLSLVDSTFPVANANATISSSQMQTFSVAPLEPATHSLSMRWFIDDVEVTATGSVLKVPGASLTAGQHAVRADLRDETGLVRTDSANDLGQSVSWTLTVNAGSSAAPAPAVNISTRLGVQTGEKVLIGGFIITGDAPKKVIVRGIGPSLTERGVQDALANPVLELHDGTGATIAANDDWRDSQQSEIEASTIPPTNELEAAIVQTLAPGPYTAILAGKGSGTGVGLVEVYDLEADANSKLANISTRGFVQSADKVMIGGFIVASSGSGQTKVVVRAIGPSLSQSGVGDALQDPTLELHDVNGATIATNDDWKQTQQAEIQSYGVAPTNDRESALAATLAAGNYTAVVAGRGGSTGVGLIEVYAVGE